MTRRILLAALALLLTGTATLVAQRGSRNSTEVAPSVPYDGRFTFVRVRFGPEGDMDYGMRFDPKWNHDYPRAERNFTRILNEISLLDPHMAGSNVMTLTEPDIFKYPVLYLCEPGFWQPTDEEVAIVRSYVQKGGFIIFDDFIGMRHKYNFDAQMLRIFPELQLVRLDLSHPIFDSFFQIESLEMYDPNQGQLAEFWGAFEDNDPNKRLLFVANYNNDIGDYWEWSDEGFLPIELSNEAYKLGVNYIIYAMTH